MDYEKCAGRILENIGGKENVMNLHHCITRLRFELRDDTKMNREEIEKIQGVQGILTKGSQYQVVLGEKVANVYDAMSMLVGDTSEKDGEKQKEIKKISVFAKIVDYFTGSVTPIVPALMSAGIIQSIIAIIDYFGLLPAESTTYVLLSCFGQAGIYFVPILLAVSASKKLKSNIYLAVVTAGILIAPEFINLVNSGGTITFFGLNVPALSYGSTFIPVLLVIPFMALIEKLISRLSFGIVKPIVVPAFTILIAAPVGLIILAPLANTISTYLSYVINWLYYDTSYFGALIIGATSPFIVLTGLHTAISFPILLNEISTGGSTYFAILTMANISVGGAALGTALKTKNKVFKGEALGAGITGVLGITEPALFGVLLRVKKPLIASGIASGIAAVCVIIFNISSNGLAMGGFGGLPVYFGDSFIPFLIVAAGDVLISAAVAYFIGFKDIKEVQ